jgi:hypothetical protein
MKTVTLKDDPAGTADLATRARAAYQNKRTRECIELTKQLLSADPENAEGKSLQAAVSADIERDLTDARALLDESRRMTDGQKYRKAAEIILLKILHIDPSHSEAQSLMTTAKDVAHIAAEVEDIGFTAQPEPVEQKPEPRSSGLGFKIPLIVMGIVLLTGGFLLYRSNATDKTGQPAKAVAKPVTTQPETPAAAITKPAAAISPVAESPRPVDVPRPVAPPPVAPAPVVPPAPAPAAKPVAEPGSLAVNSPIAADIYQGDKYLGATPTTLQLAPGRYTLEYRHGDLRTVMTHEIKSRETSTAFVTFEINVQLNSRPWAQVFLEGSTRKQLGQTPLSSVRVPIGSVLTFENPNFPPKNHRVVESDSAIQMVFP